MFLTLWLILGASVGCLMRLDFCSDTLVSKRRLLSQKYQARKYCCWVAVYSLRWHLILDTRVSEQKSNHIKQHWRG
jgi:hypothetical protein